MHTEQITVPKLTQDALGRLRTEWQRRFEGGEIHSAYLIIVRQRRWWEVWKR